MCRTTIDRGAHLLHPDPLDLRGETRRFSRSAEVHLRLARHQLLAKQQEHWRCQRLGEDIRLLLRRRHPSQLDCSTLHCLGHEMVLHIYMLGALAFDAVLTHSNG